ncbi:MAG: right-handed parallel beta-helix repeat-containing protein [Methanobrevibacter sp.]|uniref:right-handed parallel beta-helix repeat-containing protein n=1 Tax=Methanobrevibacter sp. TaxID=66852 RepID=UPI0025F3E39F|nr:Ig-like domain repeat protein [Methanobrevibacter sp.]MBQ6099063.1 right-handed parallel beta-helix repeat-containing protein [Methanobrevibacter sp.]
MNKKRFIMAILLVSIVCFASSAVFAEDASDMQDNNILAVDETPTASHHTISPGATSDDIQNTINGMKDGDVLDFKNGTYSDICIYVNKSITINGNGAKLVGYDNPSINNTPSIITNTSAKGGYGISNLATLYVVRANNVTINGLNIVGGANSSSGYSNTLVFASYANNLTFINNELDGSSWGLYLQYSHDGKITDNLIQNQAVTGLINFGSARTLIERNKVVNAKNHGIDVRHGTGPNVQVLNNTVIGSQEGIYLMHSAGHTAAFNKLINCSISSVSCCGSSNIEIYNNTFQKSRIGILFNSGYRNITVGPNTYNLNNLPYPPTFVYYIAEAQSDYNGAEAMMGTHSDSSSYSPAYKAYKEIPTPKDINIDYTKILSETGTTYNVPEDMTSADIQKMMEGMKDGDTLKFAKNAVYNNISIYTDKNIKIIGNGATLVGYDNLNLTNVPSKITATTAEGGYGISNPAVLYSVNNSGVVISDLNIVSKYPGYKPLATVPGTSVAYKTAGIRTQNSKNITITGCTVDGASWGIYLEYSGVAIVTNNEIKNQFTTGILNFGTPESIIAGNIIINVANHGIDVRHGTGPRVTVFNNTIDGAREGIYLMHSQGHNVYNNTVLGCSISGITAYGSGNENIFNNTIEGSRIGILLGGGYYNVTIGMNSYNLDWLPFPPTFVTYLAKAENKYYQNAEGTYTTLYDTIISADDAKTGKNATVEVKLTNVKGKGIANQNVSVVINNVTYQKTTDENGVAKVNAILDYGVYDVVMNYAGEGTYVKTTAKFKLTVGENIATTLSISEVTGNCTITGVLKDAEGKVMADAEITAKVGDSNVTTKTDDKGVFTIQAEDNTVVTLKYAGSEPWLASETSITLENINPVRKDTSIIAKDYNTKAIDYYAGERGGYFEVTLTDGSKPIANKAVKIGFNGKVYNTTTDENGLARLQINLGNAGTYTFAVAFLGDDDYKGAFVVQKITVTKKTTSISASAKSYKASAKTKSYTVTLKTEKGSSIDGKTYLRNGKTIKLTVNGKTYTAKTNAKGQATFKLDITKKGTYTANINFAGDNGYQASKASAKITIN